MRIRYGLEVKQPDGSWVRLSAIIVKRDATRQQVETIRELILDTIPTAAIRIVTIQDHDA
jgi:hypothetical protein